MTITQLRARFELSQSALAEKLSRSQAQVSRLESNRDLLVSSLERLADALNGELEVAIRWGNKRVVLKLGNDAERTAANGRRPRRRA